MTHILKNKSLDAAIYANYRPISNLPFLSKIIKKTVFIQLQNYFQSNYISDIFQSGFKTLHSTESTLLEVFYCILLTTDAGDTMELVLLDLSSAFDFVDHMIILSFFYRLNFQGSRLVQGFKVLYYLSHTQSYRV